MKKKNIHIVTYLLSVIQTSIFTWLLNMQKAGVMCILTLVCLLYTVNGDYIIHFTTLFTLYNNYAHSYIYE